MTRHSLFSIGLCFAILSASDLKADEKSFSLPDNTEIKKEAERISESLKKAQELDPGFSVSIEEIQKDLLKARDTLKELMPRIDAYNRSHNDYSDRKNGSLETVLQEGYAIGNELSSFCSYSSLPFQIKVLGFKIKPGDQCGWVYLDSEYFIRLARKRKSKADEEFFELQKKIRGNGVETQLVQIVTDYGNYCNRHDKIKQVYSALLRYETRYPKNWRSSIEADKEKTEKLLKPLGGKKGLFGICSCERDLNSLKSTLTELQRIFPRTQIERDSKRLLDLIKTGKLSINRVC